MKRITFSTGPLTGKTYDMPASTTQHELPDGRYQIDGETTTWCANQAEHETAHDTVPEHTHKPTQSRDGKEPWCKTCGLNKTYEEPMSKLPTKG